MASLLDLVASSVHWDEARWTMVCWKCQLKFLWVVNMTRTPGKTSHAEWGWGHGVLIDNVQVLNHGNGCVQKAVNVYHSSNLGPAGGHLWRRKLSNWRNWASEQWLPGVLLRQQNVTDRSERLKWQLFQRQKLINGMSLERNVLPNWCLRKGRWDFIQAVLFCSRGLLAKSGNIFK